MCFTSSLCTHTHTGIDFRKVPWDCLQQLHDVLAVISFTAHSLKIDGIDKVLSGHNRYVDLAISCFHLPNLVSHPCFMENQVRKGSLRQSPAPPTRRPRTWWVVHQLLKAPRKTLIAFSDQLNVPCGFHCKQTLCCLHRASVSETCFMCPKGLTNV